MCKVFGVCFASNGEAGDFKGFSHVELARVGANQIACQLAGLSLPLSIRAYHQFKHILIQISGVVKRLL